MPKIGIQVSKTSHIIIMHDVASPPKMNSDRQDRCRLPYIFFSLQLVPALSPLKRKIKWKPSYKTYLIFSGTAAPPVPNFSCLLLTSRGGLTVELTNAILATLAKRGAKPRKRGQLRKCGRKIPVITDGRGCLRNMSPLWWKCSSLPPLLRHDDSHNHSCF